MCTTYKYLKEKRKRKLLDEFFKVYCYYYMTVIMLNNSYNIDPT